MEMLGVSVLTLELGHVERTNDRDYEVEERYKLLHICKYYIS